MSRALFSNDKVKNILDYAYLVDLAVWLFINVLANITMFRVPWPDFTWGVLLYATIGIVLARFIYNFLYTGNARAVKIAALLVLLIAFGGSYLSTGYTFLLYILLFCAGAMDMDYHRVFKWFVCVCAFVFFVTVITCLCGGIFNLSFLQYRGETFVVRTAMGFYYTTDCAAFLVFFTVAAYICFDKCPCLAFSLFSLLGAAFSWYVCNARNSTLLFGILFVFSFVQWVVDDFLHERIIVDKILRILSYIMSFCAPAFALFMYICCASYKGAGVSSLLDKFDSLSNGRISLASEALNTYGVGLFGNQFNLIGAGGSGIYPEGYNFIDCGYMLILIRYGLLPLLVILAGMVFVSFMAAKRKNYRISGAIFIIAVHSILEHHMIDMHYSAFLLLPFCLIGHQIPEPSPCRLKELPWKMIGILSIAPALCIIFSNQIINILHTYMQVHSFIAGGIQGAKAGIIISAFIILIILLELGLYRIIRCKKFGKHIAVAAFVCIAFGGIYSVVSLNNFDSSSAAYTEIMADKDCVELLKDVEGAKIYVSEYPYIYQKLYDIGEVTLIPEENLSKYKDVTVLVGETSNTLIFLVNGFVFTPISEYHGIFTNDQKVINAMEQAGYVFVGTFEEMPALISAS